MSAFEQAFAVVVGSEGGYTADPRDPGNWTGGRTGAGVCAGTKWGVSASAFPDTDIAALNENDAHEIYRKHYWAAIAGDSLPPTLALLVFDAAVNNGVGRAVRWLQRSLAQTEDGALGPATLHALAAHAGEGAQLCGHYLALRLDYMTALPGWQVFGHGWARRLCALPFQAMQMEA